MGNMAPQGSSSTTPAGTGTIQFWINGKEQTVSPATVAPDTRLVDYIRYHLNAKGTKVMCREGGCGACIVVATVPDPTIEGGGTRSFSVQACQLLVYACSGWAIQTVESLGDRYKGYHPVQKALAGFYGTQCGYCSPGMVMTMYGELQRTGVLTAEQAEKALDGNICRCTGYRPILDAFKSLSVDGDSKLKLHLADIEEAYKSTCPKSGQPCASQCGGGGGCGSKELVKAPAKDIAIIGTSAQWYQPITLKGVYSAILKAKPQEKVLLVAGNTGSGVFKNDGPYSIFVSLDGVTELQKVSSTVAPLVIGCRVPLTRCIEVFRELASGNKAVTGYSHLQEIADHWQVVANLAVRNNGSWAGNLMMKNVHKEFPSDVFLTLSVCDATLTVGDAATEVTSQVKVIDIPKTDMTGKVILSVSIPPMPEGTYVRTFKITPRAVNAHAYVNAAFRLPLVAAEGFKVASTPSLLFGGLGPDFVSASNTEKYLVGKKLSEVAVVQEVVKQLASEVVPTPDPHQGSVQYRRALVQSLVYKTLVWLQKDKVSPAVRSAGDKLTRSLSKGQQQFDANSESWPVGQAIPKVESAIQVAGEAEYADDLPVLPGELHGAFVLSTHANAKIDNVDASLALAVPGVVDFITATDIPGVNNFMNSGRQHDKIFATGRSQYAGQSLGLIVAETRETAFEAVKLVQVTYSDLVKPLLTIKEAIKTKVDKQPVDFFGAAAEQKVIGDFDKLMKAAPNKLTGEMDINTQCHFAMELMTARVAPMEDGYDVVCTTQHINESQSSIAQALNISANSINMQVRRIGGGFGGKISRCNSPACAAAVAAAKTKRPVRIFMDLPSQMSLLGWREPYYTSYEAGFDNSGKLDAVKINIYGDSGFVSNEASVSFTTHLMANTYHSNSWNFVPRNVNTDTAANTWCRTPAHVEAIAAIENVLEHVAYFLNKDPLEVREANLAPDAPEEKGGPNVFRSSILPLLKEKAMIDQRKLEIVEFNKVNRWRKRGLSVIPLKYPFPYPPPFRYSAQVIIYEHDGTVAIAHGGIEMGQGINTKAAQVAAKILDVPLSSIKVKPTTTVAGANSMVTGGSYGTDLVCHGVKICCERLKARIDAVKANLPNPKPEWPALVKTCLHKEVDLSERYWTVSTEHPKPYIIWGGTCVEVEIDVLTGQHVTRRVDLIEDAGRSLSPFVDIGQVEGAFVMGLGLFTTEYMQFDEQTGEKLVTGTWDYKPPTALDIPEDFRITLLPNAPNPYGVLRSKATGEPPLCMSFGVVTALRQAISSARADAGVTGWFEMGSPMTVERIQQLCLVQPSQFILSDAVASN